jgi:hypothetical protein
MAKEKALIAEEALPATPARYRKVLLGKHVDSGVDGVARKDYGVLAVWENGNSRVIPVSTIPFIGPVVPDMEAIRVVGGEVIGPSGERVVGRSLADR